MKTSVFQGLPFKIRWRGKGIWFGRDEGWDGQSREGRVMGMKGLGR